MTFTLQELIEQFIIGNDAYYREYHLVIPSTWEPGGTIDVYDITHELVLDDHEPPLTSHHGSTLVDVLTYLKYWMDWHTEE